MKTPESIREMAEQLLTPERIVRLREVLARRLSCITVIFENIADPNNVAACLRSAEAFGLCRIHLVTKELVKLNPIISATANRWLDVQRHAALGPLIRQLHEDGYLVLGTTPPRGATPFTSVELPDKLALLMGGESEGLTAEARAACDGLITIPMQGFTESLNLSTATAILLQHFTTRYRESGRPIHLTPDEQEQLYLEWCARDIRVKTRGQLAR